MKRLILASGSEWRAKMLSWLDVPFDVIVSDVDEGSFQEDDLEDLVCTLAIAKAQKVASQVANDDAIIIAADTMVEHEGRAIGKPENLRHAREIISSLAGSTHDIWTGICLIDTLSGEEQHHTERTSVTFTPMSNQDIDTYLKSGDWDGKAGAYQLLKAIQPFVESVDGSATNVIGLPLLSLADMLEHIGYPIDVAIPDIIEQNTGYRD